MNIERLRLMKKHTDTVNEQTKTKPRETFDFKLKKQLETFPFNPPINLVKEGKRLLGVTFFESPNSVYIISDENNSISITILCHWQTISVENLLTN